MPQSKNPRTPRRSAREKKQDKPPEEGGLLTRPRLKTAKHEPLRRQQAKQQVTVRIDKELLQVVLPHAKDLGMNLTDVVEEGLWDWVRKNKLGAAHIKTAQLRFLCARLPLHVQKLMLGFVSFVSAPGTSEYQELFRRHLYDFFDAFADDPRSKEILEGLNRILPRMEAAPPPEPSSPRRISA